jgi:clan AA aspartic protease (TIGR02281 family)
MTRWWIGWLLGVSMLVGCAERQQVNPDSVQLPYSFISCAVGIADKRVRESPEMNLENVAGFAHAECQSHIDSLIASLGLTYTDRVWVIASLERRAGLQSRKIALDAKLNALRVHPASASPASAATSAGVITKEQAKAAVMPWVDCVYDKIVAIDDGSAAPTVVANVIRAQCHRLWIGSTEQEMPLMMEAIGRARAYRRGVPYVARASVPATPAQRSTSKSSTVMKKDRGIYVVPVTINNAITLDFAVDSGASDVSIPEDIVNALIGAGTIRDTDFIGEKTYMIADGSKVKSRIFRIRSLMVGDRIVENVIGSVAPKGVLLLGQSFLGRFKSWSIDNSRHALVLE